ncbi:protein of unknown function [Azospirillum lipoferum 4B]|uniref:Uncharacterized protein n=1 Tax=Azospirillum lipoferum (strain 4B) TaxID=862719 RepID=G7Z363_AZOL4|nr:protein of unknown function [Azospirillum lipoferum 4B]
MGLRRQHKAARRTTEAGPTGDTVTDATGRYEKEHPLRTGREGDVPFSSRRAPVEARLSCSSRAASRPKLPTTNPKSRGRNL